MSAALILLDNGGRILHANSTACDLWRLSVDDFLKLHCLDLFDFEVISANEEMRLEHWEALLASASASRQQLQLARAYTDCVSEVSFQVEALPGKDTRYVAIVLPDEVERGCTELPPIEKTFSFLTQHGALACFDLNFIEGVCHYSSAWKRMLGYVDAELANSHDVWKTLLHPDDSSAAPDRIGRRTIEPGITPISLEFRMKHRAGNWVWVHCIGLREIGIDGRVARVAGIHLDITERKELEEAAILGEERMQALGMPGPIGLFDADFSTGSVWMSAGLATITGYEEAGLPHTGDTLFHLLAENSSDADLASWLANQGSPGTASFCVLSNLRHYAGTTVPVLIGAQRRFSRKKELQRAIGFCCTVPAHSRQPDTNPLWDQSRTLIENAMGCLAEGVLITDADGRVRFINAQALHLLRCADSKSIVDQPVGDVFHLVRREDLRSLDSTVSDMVLASEIPLSLIQTHAVLSLDSQTSPIPVVWSAKTVIGKDSRPEGIIITFRNPEEMSLSPEELVKANRYEALALLAGGIAHDFNNLLTTILGGISLARENRDYTALEESDKSCMAAKALTKQLLSFVKGGSGVRTVCSSLEIIQDAVKIAAAGSTAQVAISAKECLPPVKVDKPQILQVFQNLIVNALQAMPPQPHRAHIMLDVATVEIAQGQMPPLTAGTYIKYEVRDNGAGIPASILEKIWDPFFTTKKHGTGLGLATVLSIVRKHGGLIGVQSQPGVGTVFTVFLPATSAEVEVQARRAPTLRFGTGRILFMDDDPKICALTANMLTSLDYKFDIANSGEEAIKLYRSYLNIGRPYDVVLMDLTVIGGLGGEEAFKELKQLDPDVRAIACSGYDNEEIARRFLDLGFCGYLTKPYRVTDLGKILKTVLG